MMNQRFKYLAGFGFVLSLLVGTAALQQGVSASDDAVPVAGVSAGVIFTDADGAPRLPSAAERAELAAAFQADLANLTRNKRIPSGSKKEPSGAVSAVVGTRNIRFLVVSVDENGQASFEHASMGEDGHIETAPANELPEM
ncbi:MAG: hypothetical protein OEQ14_18560 [Gammaproteobacteria bacterium]|nr:hypothetical protein [Gammaproteobacteria bacterium]